MLTAETDVNNILDLPTINKQYSTAYTKRIEQRG
jgi:hypothetical protein